MLELDLTKVGRDTALRTWLTYHKLSNADIARALKVDPSFISLLLKGKRRSDRIRKKLVDLGIPEELLPGKDE